MGTQGCVGGGRGDRERTAELLDKGIDLATARQEDEDA